MSRSSSPRLHFPNHNSCLRLLRKLADVPYQCSFSGLSFAAEVEDLKKIQLVRERMDRSLQEHLGSTDERDKEGVKKHQTSESLQAPSPEFSSTNKGDKFQQAPRAFDGNPWPLASIPKLPDQEPSNQGSTLNSYALAGSPKNGDNTRPFICSFSHYGYESRFCSKNEWKRHESSQRLPLGFYRCDMQPCNPDFDHSFLGGGKPWSHESAALIPWGQLLRLIIAWIVCAGNTQAAKVEGEKLLLNLRALSRASNIPNDRDAGILLQQNDRDIIRKQLIYGGKGYSSLGSFPECYRKFMKHFGSRFLTPSSGLANSILRRVKVAAFLGTLPLAHAAPTGASTRAEHSSFSSSLHIPAWMTTISVASATTYVGLHRAGRDLVLSGVLSFFTSVAPLVFSDARAVSQIIWPTLTVGLIFLVNFWKNLFHHHAMGMAWMPVVLIGGLVLDATIVHHASGSQSNDQGLFSQLLLACMALSLSACSAVTWFLRGITFRRPPHHLA